MEKDLDSVSKTQKYNLRGNKPLPNKTKDSNTDRRGKYNKYIIKQTGVEKKFLKSLIEQ